MTHGHYIAVILIVFFAEIELISGLYNVITVTNEEKGSADLQVTRIRRIPRCCGDGQGVGFNKTCRFTDGKYGSLDFSEVPLFYGNFTKTGRSLKDVYSFEMGKFQNELFKTGAYNYLRVHHNYYLTEEEILYQEIPNELHRWHKLNKSFFCVEYILPFHRLIRKPQARFWTILDSKNEILYDDPYITTGLLVSSVFLALVLFVYCLLPELRNLGGLVLMAYVGSLLGAFVVLATLQIGRFTKYQCKGLTYGTYFFFLASFCWMNVMSCDIWWTFRGYAKARPIHRRGERFKFVMYSLYGFGVPAAMTVVLGTLDNIYMKHLPWIITPNIPRKGCFIGDDSKLFYLYIPMLILILCNWAFFLMTAFNIWRLHRGTAVLDSAASGTPAAHRKQRYRLMIYLKLSIIMGVNWVMEVVSSFYPHLKLWIFTDVYNVLIGVSIFLIFVCKRKILRKLMKKFNGWNETWQRSQYSKSRSSHTTDSEVSQDAPLQVCPNPKGPVYVIHNKM